MTLEGLAAVARPEGNRIALTWTRPDPDEPQGVRVVRRLGAFPGTPVPGVAAEGVVVADTDPGAGAPNTVDTLPDGRVQVVDDGLMAETVYYYQVYPYTGDPAAYDRDDANRTSAMATGPYDFAGLLWRLLPAIYHRYDSAPAHAPAGQLRRFLQLPGEQLDQLYSGVRSLHDLHDLTRVDGRLVPLLADWIGWRTDQSIGLDRQRAEIRSAPALYHAVQTVAAVEATVSRVAGWASRTKEFVDNVFLTNRPERLTLWLAQATGEGGWVLHDRPLSGDEAHDGRPVAVTEAGGRVRLLYATRAADRTDLRSKVHAPGHEVRDWAPSRPVVARPGVDRDPVAVVRRRTVWVFWAVHDQGTGRWRIDFRTGTRGAARGAGEAWSPVSTFADGPDDQAERRAPAALVDGDGALWLFWLERAELGWGLRYGRFTGDRWVPTPAGSVAFPDDDESVPRVEADVSVAFRPPRAGDPRASFRRLWVLWSRREPVAGDPEQTRWRIACRSKDGTDPADLTDWGAVSVLAHDHDHDREPAALALEDGDLAVFFSSTRDGSWSVWQAGIDAATAAFGAPSPVTGPPFSERAPVPFRLGNDIVVVYRSNRSLTYDSSVYRATQTTDRRYSGSTTVRAANAAAIALRGGYDDFATYTFDAGVAGRTDEDRYAPNTIGLYLQPDTADPEAIQAGRERIRRVLPEFLPATERAVLL